MFGWSEKGPCPCPDCNAVDQECSECGSVANDESGLCDGCEQEQIKAEEQQEFDDALKLDGLQYVLDREIQPISKIQK